MVDLMQYGSDVSPGDYICADCGYLVKVRTESILPFCPNRRQSYHTKNGWRPVYGRRSVADETSAAALPIGARR